MKHLIPLISLFFLIGCLNDSDPFGDPVDQTDYLEEYAMQEGVVQTNSGLLYKILEEGEGGNPPSGSIVFIEYRGTLIDGQQRFTTDGDLRLSFLESQNLTPGLHEGIQLMREGARYEFVLPTELAFGNNPPTSNIRPGAVLIFNVFLDSYLREPEDFLAENALQEDVLTTESGLQYRIIEEGEGEKPGPANLVSFKYKGSYPNGYIFQQTTGNDTFDSIVNALNPGLTEGLQLMNEGGTFEFFIPPGLGYGNDEPQFGNVIVFEIELVDIH